MIGKPKSCGLGWHHLAFRVARYVVCALSLCAVLVGCGPSQREQQQQQVAEELRKLGHSEETIAAELKRATEGTNGTPGSSQPGPTQPRPAQPAWTRSPVDAPKDAPLSKEARPGMSFELGFNRPASPERQGMTSQQIAEAILNGKNATPQDFVDFVRACPASPPGRELLMKVAARGVEVCPPNDYTLLEMATGLLEYGLENPDDQAMEATVGMVEAIANAEEDRFGSESGDAVYIGFAEKLTHTPAVHMTGNVPLNSLGQPDKKNLYFLNRQNRNELLLLRLDYERVVRGIEARLKANPEDLGLAVTALELGYQTRDRKLASLGMRYFDKHPELVNQPVKHGDIWAHIDWAKAP